MELLVYKASAGSGKTFTLAVEYIKHLIINPHAYRQILAVTFTNKATAEMKERILTQLYGIWKGAPSSEAYLERIKNYKLKIKGEGGGGLTDKEIRQRAGIALQYMLHDYSRFRVETIDSFFQSVMRNLARELELSPNLNIELNNSEVLSDAVDSLIEKLTPTSPVLAWLLDYIDERIRDDKRWNVSNEVKSFGRNIFDESYIERGEKLRQCLRTPNTLKLYRDVLRDMETEALEQMKSFYDQFEGELEGHALTPEDLKGGARGIGSYFRKLRDGRLSDKDVLNATLQNSLADAKNWATKTSSRKDDIICLAKTSLIPLLQEAERMRPQRNRTLNSCRLSLQHLNKLQLLNHIDEEVRTLNREHNRFLLSDTNALLHKLVREGDSSFVFEKIGANIRNVMIDEFQDTSRMQWDNFRLLLLEGLSQGADSLIVGDVKQSIYRWRNGDWGILNSLGNKELNLNSFPVRVETLKTNRRSETNIIRFNNQVFTAAIDYLNALHLNELKEDCLPLKRAYADVVQESPKSTEYGYVKATFLEPDDEHNYTEQTLLALGEEVQRLLEEGVTLNDITILVRKNKNIPPIADYFDKELHLSVVSDEAFRLDAFVGDAQFCKIAAVVAVDVAQFIPEGDEFGFQLRALFYGKVLEELADGFFLFLVEEVVIVHNVLQFLQVAEEFVGIYKVFVYVIEIADEQFSPEVEVIQSFFAAGLFAEYLIQFAYQTDRVTGLQWRELPEQFADADVGRRPQRAVRFSCQIFVEEQTGTFVGENDGGAREVVSYFGVKVAGDQLEECFHDLVDN